MKWICFLEASFVISLQVLAYAVIVAEDYTKPTENKLTLPKWQDVQQFRTWPPYQVSYKDYLTNN